jgi:hypothetical protein
MPNSAHHSPIGLLLPDKERALRFNCPNVPVCMLANLLKVAHPPVYLCFNFDAKTNMRVPSNMLLEKEPLANCVYGNGD